VTDQYVSAPCLDQHLTRDFTRISALSVLAHILSPQPYHLLLIEQSCGKVEMHMGRTENNIYIITNTLQALTRKLL
jgi:hypothetical protein